MVSWTMMAVPLSALKAPLKRLVKTVLSFLLGCRNWLVMHVPPGVGITAGQQMGILRRDDNEVIYAFQMWGVGLIAPT